MGYKKGANVDKMTKHTVAIIAVSFSTAAFAETAQPVSAAPTTDSHIVTF